MAATVLNNFTITVDPFDGVLLTDANTFYIDADGGVDTNPGTRNLPWKSLSMITLINGIRRFVLRGQFQDGLNMVGLGGNNTTRAHVIGDLNTQVRGACAFGGVEYNSQYTRFHLSRIDFDNIIVNMNGNSTFIEFWDCTATSIISTSANVFGINLKRTFTRTFTAVNVALNTGSEYITCGRLNVASNSITIIANSIVTDLVNFGLGTTTGIGTSLYNSIVRKQVQYSWNNEGITVDWTQKPGSMPDIDYVKQVLTTFATSSNVPTVNQANFLSQINTFFANGTIIYDDIAPNIRMFSLYDSQDLVLDYSLNPQNGNPALFTSAFSTFVGANRPKVNLTFGSSLEVDALGNPTGNAGTLLVNNNGIFIDITSSQTRNKMETVQNPFTNAQGVVMMNSGDRFTQLQALFFASNSLVLYLGSTQNLAGRLNPINAVIIQPYDTPTAISSFPKFMAPINKDCQIAFYATGSKAGTPVLFKDLIDPNVISEYFPVNTITSNRNIGTFSSPGEVDNWAVTNAVDEWDDLITTAEITVQVVSIRYFKVILIGNKTQ